MTGRRTPDDPDGQPLNPFFNAARRRERDVSELLGLAKGVLLDGKVSTEEAGFLHTWLDAHPDAANIWPCSKIAERLTRIYLDGHVSEEECDDLRELLSSLVGGDAGILAGSDASTRLPVDEPPPSIDFREQVFVLTGKFAMGPRSACQRLVTAAGGICEPDVTKRTRYLVIGTFGSRDWVQTSYGRKIQKAVEYREDGLGLAIVEEDHWARALP